MGPVVLGAVVARRILHHRAGVEVASPLPDGEVVWPHDAQYVVDSVVGWRPRRDITFRIWQEGHRIVAEAVGNWL